MALKSDTWYKGEAEKRLYKGYLTDNEIEQVMDSQSKYRVLYADDTVKRGVSEKVLKKLGARKLPTRLHDSIPFTMSDGTVAQVMLDSNFDAKARREMKGKLQEKLRVIYGRDLFDTYGQGLVDALAERFVSGKVSAAAMSRYRRQMQRLVASVRDEESPLWK